MNAVDHKTEIGLLNGTPDKRMFWSIISDYDLQTALCELIDNAIDLWHASHKDRNLVITLTLDVDRQLIRMQDNAGGVRHEDLNLLITPGGSNNNPYSSTIGVFGVGSKRAVIALAEKVTIKTRFADDQSFQIDIDDVWLTSPRWDLPVYKLPFVDPGTTMVELTQLRRPIRADDEAALISHLGETYAQYLSDKCRIAVNGVEVAPVRFDEWAYPPDHLPRHVLFSVKPDGENEVVIEVRSGLIRQRDSSGEDYGVYVYCNDRLIVKRWRTRDVGYYISSEAGVPHSDASLCRAVVSFAGPARLMPWNSSKTGISPAHATFQMARPTITKLVTHFSKTSRALRNHWEEIVFPFDTGELVATTSEEALEVKKLVLPPVPRSRKTHAEKLMATNAATIEEKPWTLGIVEAFAAVDIVARQHLQTKNRIALLLLDSSFEIALKEFIVHRADLFPANQYTSAYLETLFRDRPAVIAKVTQHVPIPPDILGRASHYYGVRNKLVHERATIDVVPADIDNYRDAVGKVVALLFGLNVQ